MRGTANTGMIFFFQQKHHEAGQEALAGTSADGGLGVVHLHHIGVLKAAEKVLAAGDALIGRLRFNPVKIANFGRLLEAQADKVQRFTAPGSRYFLPIKSASNTRLPSV